MEKPNFTGYWVLSKTESLDDFLRGLGFPWIVRKAAFRFGSSAVDLVHHEGSCIKIASLNAKGSWTRVCNTKSVIEQPDALGTRCRTSTWWEGNVLRTRFVRGNVMVVKTTIKAPQGGEAMCFWFFERMEALESHLGGGSMSHLLHAVKRDQSRVVQATKRDTRYLRKVLLETEKWMSPADEFISIGGAHAASPRSVGSATGTGLALRGKTRGSAARLKATNSPSSTPCALSKSPSSQSLTASPSDADLGRRKSGNITGTFVESGSNQNIAPGMALSRSDKKASISSTQDLEPTPSVAGMTTETEETQASPGPSSLSASQANLQRINATSGVTQGTSQSRPPPATGSGAPTQQAHFMHSLQQNSSNAVHNRVRSTDAASAMSGTVSVSLSRRAVHYRSPSAESVPSTSLSLATPLSSPSQATAPPPTGPEALMVYKLKEYLDSRGIVSVVPVSLPNDTAEPELLGMSPEQAEETTAQLRELETELLLRRQGTARGWECCGLVLQWKSDTLPDHLRVWEMTLA